MGQKFSGIKIYFANMERRENTVPRNIHSNSERRSQSSLQGSDDDTTALCNGPTKGLNQHFETIYNGCVENSNVEENGNNHVSTVQSTSSVVKNSLDSIPENVYQRADEQNTACSLRKGSTRTLTARNGKKFRNKRSSKDSDTKKKKSMWVLKFNCVKLKGASSGCSTIGTETDIPEPNVGCDNCVCTGYRRTEEHHLGAGVVFDTTSGSGELNREVNANESITNEIGQQSVDVGTMADVLIDVTKFNSEDFSIEDCEEKARLERAREIAEGVEAPPDFNPFRHGRLTLDELTALFQTHLGIPSAALSAALLDRNLSPTFQQVHSQIDYIHCLVPDLLQITSCSFYWGKMDRYEAERLLEGRPEGTFLLRDSAQEEFLFSVSFRKYGRSLHARIEQWNHQFSFDSHDPSVFASPTVCGLIEHYKDPSCCMFFEPMLTIPLHRNFPFPLQHLCRAVVCSKVKYDGINQLHLPKSLKVYLKEYHYKQRVRVKKFDLEQ